MNWIFPPACCLERFPSLKESQWNQVVSMRRTDREHGKVEWMARICTVQKEKQGASR